MIKAVIADTTPLYALVDSSDQYHLKARQELSRVVVRNRVSLSISR